MRILKSLAAVALAVLTAMAALAPDTHAETAAFVDSGDGGEQPRRHRADRVIADSEAEIYDQGTDALDDHDWRRAEGLFKGVAQMKLAHADAALYWLAYAQNKMGHRGEALATLVTMQKEYPKSRWSGDAKSLELEIRHASGQRVSPERLGDEDRLIILNDLVESEPNRAIPMLVKIIRGEGSPRMKERALFVLTQTGSPEAVTVVGDIAKEEQNEPLRKVAVRYLGTVGSDLSRKILSDVYGTTTDAGVKRIVVRSLITPGDRERLLKLAKSEPNIELRGDALLQLGIVGARGDLAELYTHESSVPLRRRILQSLLVCGSTDKLVEIAQTDKVPELRATAIRNLGLAGPKTGARLVSLYESDKSPEVRRAAVEALFFQNNLKSLQDLEKKEKDPALKKVLASKIEVLTNGGDREIVIELPRD
ncbi:MAG TPA: HEAT repeat domain-containing protein [Thermoanaerobaculia bacterium]|nr:HEAT repeat domain-containing protein [Thermoanaerobaculia bacterium]